MDQKASFWFGKVTPDLAVNWQLLSYTMHSLQTLPTTIE